MLLQVGAPVEKPVDQDCREENDDVIQEKDAPIGQGPLGEIPVDQVLEQSHSSCGGSRSEDKAVALSINSTNVSNTCR
jgi:hypothetical protein